MITVGLGLDLWVWEWSIEAVGGKEKFEMEL